MGGAVSLPDTLDWYSVDLQDPEQRLAVLAVMLYILDASSPFEILERAHETQVYANQMGALNRAVREIREQA